MLTTDSNIFECTLEQAEFIAECAGLRLKITSRLEVKKENPRVSYNCGIYEYWEDRQTCGGGCRIVFCNNIAWISRHSGYAYADITEEVAQLFLEIGCKSLENKYWELNPYIYGDEKIKEKLGVRNCFGR